MRLRFRALSLIIGLCALIATHRTYAEAAVGQPAPAFVAPTLDGKNFDLSSLKGKVVILHFWASWCLPCREEMPALESVWRHTHGQGVEVLAVSADRPRARGDVDQVMHYFTFPAAMLNATTKNDFGIPASIPVTYVIGKDGNIAAILTPDVMPVTEAALGDEVKTLLEIKSDSGKDSKAEAKP